MSPVAWLSHCKIVAANQAPAKQSVNWDLLDSDMALVPVEQMLAVQ